MKLRSITSVSVAAMAAALLPLTAASADFRSSYCTDPGTLFAQSADTRANTRSTYAYLDREGYHWGGGCANLNDADDSPGETPEALTPYGEGPDCSGLVYRVWELADSSSNAGFYYKYQRAWVHGPFPASAFRSSTATWTVVSKTSLAYMDSVASTGHVGLYLGGNADGTGNYFEAKQESVGTGVHAQTYRTNTAYVAARRNGWSG
jgi:cell wall-associated NlpC family hydrolase